MILKTLILCSALILVKTGLLQAQDISYTYNEILRIGNAEAFDENYSFTAPHHISVGPKGRLYIADRRMNEVRIYDADGTFVNKIGQRGRGPGEFIEVSAMYLDPSRNHLIVVDRMNLRVTRFDSNGNYLETHMLPEGPVISPWMGRADEQGNHYLLYRIPVMPNQPRPADDHLVHVYGPSFESVRGSTVEASLFGNLENYLIDSIIGSPNTGLFEFISQERLIAAPYIYEGEIFLFEKMEKEWIKTGMLQGRQPEYETFHEIDANHSPDYARQMGTPRGVFAYLINSATVGLQLLNENILAHYTHFQDENYENGEVGVSLFNIHTGDYLGYTKIKELSIDHLEPIASGWNIQIKTYEDNKIYFVDNRYNDPHVVVAEVEFTLK